MFVNNAYLTTDHSSKLVALALKSTGRNSRLVFIGSTAACIASVISIERDEVKPRHRYREHPPLVEGRLLALARLTSSWYYICHSFGLDQLRSSSGRGRLVFLGEFVRRLHTRNSYWTFSATVDEPTPTFD